ncbi:unnamed protein product [Allacma fusca]|uniref:lysozyme n=1 Tax=Allacma fusca TaxID=39272 RepID=A0A8J2K638_9HEXA|nr:unnamed protein product [Allacma fusca]
MARESQRIIILLSIVISFVGTVCSQGRPIIEGCFTRRNRDGYESCGEVTEFSTSEFAFNGLSKDFRNNTVNLTSRGDYLYLKCIATAPVRWLSHKPTGRITHGGTTYRMGSGSAPAQYTQEIFVHLSQDFSKILRCEYFNNSTLAAEIFLNSPDGKNNPKFVPFETQDLNYFEVEKNPSGEYIIPCTAKSFGADPTVTLTKRNSSAEIFSAKCAICACFGKTDCPNDTFPCFSKFMCGPLPQPIWDNETNPIEDYDDCMKNFGCSVCTIHGHMRKFPPSGKDCNGDGILTCEDFVQQFYFGESSCGRELNQEEKPIYDRFKSCYDMAEENFTILTDKSTFDPRMGFKIKELPDFENMYECSNLLYNLFYVTPLAKERRVRASLSLDNTNPAKIQIYCEPMQELHNTNLQIGLCSSITECDLIYKPMKPFVSFVEHKYPLKSELDQFININRTHTKRLKFTHGFVQCTAIFSPYNQPNVFGYMYESGYMFQGVLGNAHFFQDNFQGNESIRVGFQTSDNKIANQFYVVECEISTFVLMPYVRFYIKYGMDDTPTELDPNSGDPRLRKYNDKSRPDEEKLTKKITMEVQLSIDAKQISCEAPSIDTGKYFSSTKTFDTIAEPLGIIQFISIGVSVVLFLVLAISLLVFWWKYHTSKGIIRNLTKYEVDEFFNGIKTHTEGDEEEVMIEALGFSKDKAIAQHRLVTNTEDVLGSGEYGVVCRGTLDGSPVAVKTTKPNADVEYFKAFLKEIKVINFIGEHANIVYFHGAVVDKIQKRICFAVFELSPHGNLNNYLKDYATNYAGSMSEKSEKKIPVEIPDCEAHLVLNQSILTSFCNQIATGMAFLAEKKVIHGDLATRNVLVFPNNVVKITDFGLSRKLYECGNYVKEKQAPLPWRWMALESLRFMQFSSQSDVWSLGVTVWEIFSFAQVPYAGLTWSPEFANEIEGGLRLNRPQQATPEVFDWMTICWQNEPEKRPTMSECKGFFINLQSKVNQEDQIYGSYNEHCQKKV